MRGTVVAVGSFALATAALVIAASRPAYGGTASLAWNPVPDADVAGYRVYYGAAPGVYTQSVDVGNVTQARISGLSDCTGYFFAAKAYDTSGNQSTSYSNEIQGWSRPVVASATPSAAAQGQTLTLKVAGASFRAGATAAFSSPGITVNSATVNACGQLTVSVTVGTTATVGASDLAVTNPDGTFGMGTAVFTVQAATDQAPPAADTGFTATGGMTQVTLAWTNSSSVDFSQTIIRYRTDGQFPVSPVDGRAVIVKPGSVGSTDSFVHTGLTSGTTYFYSAFAQDANGNVSPAANATANPTDAPPPSPVIALVQHVARDAGTVTSSSLAFPEPNTAGNLIAVIVRAGRSSAVVSVADSAGNTYRQAAKLDVTLDTPYGDTLSAFYAEDIQPGMNTVRVSSSLDGASLRFAILEYAGIARANSLDGTASAQGSDPRPNSGTATTTANGDLLLGAVMTGDPGALTPDIGFALREQVAAKLLAEDQIQASAGPASAGATLLAGDAWGAMVVAFRAEDTQRPTAPAGLTATVAGGDRIDLSWTASTDNVGVSRYRVEQCQGASCTEFAEIAQVDTTSCSITGLSAGVYRYRVRAEDAAGNLGPYSHVASGTIWAIALVQHGGVAAGTAASASLPFATANAAGNFIAVAIRYAPSSETLTVADSAGNTYRKATQWDNTVDGMSVALYYAENIAGGSNAVTVSKPQSGGTLRFAAFEYSGVALTGSLDGTAGAQGAGTTPDSGTVTPTSSGELVIGAIATADEQTFTPADGYVLDESVLAAPRTKLIVEDQTQTAPGPVSAGATLSSADDWAAVVATFRAR